MPKCLMQDGAIALWVLHIHGSSICGCEMPTVCLKTVYSYLLLLLRGFLKSSICLKLGGLIFFSFLPLFSLIFLKSVSLMCLSTDIVCRHFSSSSLQLCLSCTVFSGLDNTGSFLVPSQCLTLKKGCSGEIVWNCSGIVWNCFHDDRKTYFELDAGFEGLNPTTRRYRSFQIILHITLCESYKVRNDLYYRKLGSKNIISSLSSSKMMVYWALAEMQ